MSRTLRVAVAGAGIAGSCAARVLREAGHEVTVFDPNPSLSASQCAFAVIHIAYRASESERNSARRSLGWYADHGWITTTVATVYDVRRGKVIEQDGRHLIDPGAPLVLPDVRTKVRTWYESPGRGVTVSTAAGWSQFDALVLAAGPGTQGLAPVVGEVSYGGMFTARGDRLAADTFLSLLRRTDRLSYTAAYVNGQTRIGASRCASPEQARRLADGIRDRLLSEGVVTGSADDYAYRSGVRYATKEPGRTRLKDRVWTLTGLARSGYAFAPAAAMEIADEIGALT